MTQYDKEPGGAGFEAKVQQTHGASFCSQIQCIQKSFSQTLFDFKKLISGPIELKCSGKTLHAIL